MLSTPRSASLSTSIQTRLLCIGGLILSLCANSGGVSTGPPNKPGVGLVPVSSSMSSSPPLVTPEFVDQRIQAFLEYLHGKGYLIHAPLNGYPDGYWEGRLLDPDTLEPIPKGVLPWDLLKELPPDIIEGLTKGIQGDSNGP